MPITSAQCLLSMESQAALGHIASWPLGRYGLRRFPKISLHWNQEGTSVNEKAWLSSWALTCVSSALAVRFHSPDHFYPPVK